MKDKELWELVLLGDVKAYSRLFNQHYRQLCHYAVGILKLPEIAEEIVQVTFVKIWENRHTININSSIQAYLLRSVHNNCISYCRGQSIKQKQDRKLLDEINRHAAMVTEGLTENTLESIINGELEAVLDQAIQSLPEQCRKIFSLSRYDQLTYQEIADKLGISVNTVKTQLSRAFAKIRKAYLNFKKT